MQQQKNLAFSLCVLSCLALAACSGDSAGDNRSGTGGTGAAGNAGSAGSAGVGGAMTGSGGSVGSGGSAGVGGASRRLLPGAIVRRQARTAAGTASTTTTTASSTTRIPNVSDPATTPKGPILLTGTPGETEQRVRTPTATSTVATAPGPATASGIAVAIHSSPKTLVPMTRDSSERPTIVRTYNPTAARTGVACSRQTAAIASGAAPSPS